MVRGRGRCGAHACPKPPPPVSPPTARVPGQATGENLTPSVTARLAKEIRALARSPPDGCAAAPPRFLGRARAGPGVTRGPRPLA